MSQYDFGDLESPLPGASFINGNLEPWRDALHTCHKGSARPSYAQTGMLWIDDSTDPDWLVKIYDGTQDVTLGTLDSTTHIFTPSGVTAPTADNVSFDPTGTDFTGTDVQSALEDLDSAAFEPTSAFATAAQGALADTALQPGYIPPQNIEHVTKTDTFSGSVAAGAVSSNVTGLTVTIEPTSATNKLHISGVISMGSPAGRAFLTLYRDGSPIEIGDSSGSRQRVTCSSYFQSSDVLISIPIDVIVDAGSVSSTTFSVRLSHGATSTQTLYVNRSPNDSNDAQVSRSISSLAVKEIPQ